MSTPNPVLSAAAPELIAMIKALQQFNADMGTNPALWGVNFPGAKLKETGAIMLQVPALATAEAGAGLTALDNVYAGWITKLTPPTA